MHQLDMPDYIADREYDASPFLKWAGGKSQLLDQYESYFPDSCEKYFEPFIGGGAIFFYLRQRPGFARHYLIADINEELILTYRAVRDNVDELIKHLHNLDKRHRQDAEKQYYAVRAWDRSPGFIQRKAVSRAARFIYLNRTCFNGLWRVNSEGKFNVPMGRYTNPTILDADRLQRAASTLKGVVIVVADFEDAVAEATAGDFVYFDPPYVPINDTSNFTSYYTNGFGLAEQERLAGLFLDLHVRGCRVMLSNSDTEIVHTLYGGLGIESLQVNRVFARRQINSDSGKRGGVTELVITNYLLSKAKVYSRPSSRTV